MGMRNRRLLELFRGERESGEEAESREMRKWEQGGNEIVTHLNFSLQEKVSVFLMELEALSFLRILILPQAKECITLLNASSGSWYIATRLSYDRTMGVVGAEGELVKASKTAA
jgi:hypothetical protein